MCRFAESITMMEDLDRMTVNPVFFYTYIYDKIYRLWKTKKRMPISQYQRG